MNAIQRPGFDTLVKLAAEARGQEWADDLNSALSAAIFAGWTWERAFLSAARLIVDDQASGRDLLHEVQNRGSDPCPPTPEWDMARAALGRRGPVRAISEAGAT